MGYFLTVVTILNKFAFSVFYCEVFFYAGVVKYKQFIIFIYLYFPFFLSRLRRVPVFLMFNYGLLHAHLPFYAVDTGNDLYFPKQKTLIDTYIHPHITIFTQPYIDIFTWMF